MTDHLEIQHTWTKGRLEIICCNGEARHADVLNPMNAMARKRFLTAFRQAIPAATDDAVAQVDRFLVQQAAQGPPADERKAPPPPEEDPGAEGDRALAAMQPSIVDEARAMLHAPDLLPRIMHDVQRIGIVGEHDLALTVYLTGTSRLLPRPLAGIVQGSSSSGKSHVVEGIGSMFPRECTLLATDLTTNALYYLPPGSLRHRFVVAGERSRVQDDDRAEATRALREMLSSGVLRKVLPQKNSDGAIETIVIESPGPIAFIETTTLAEIFEEDKTRALLLASDDGHEQTRAVVTAIAGRYAGAAPDDADGVKARHHALQRMLRRVAVQVPFAHALAQRVPDDRPEARRAIHQILTVVQSVALLHQFQRHDNPKHGSIVRATTADYRVARRLLAAPLARALGAALPDHVVSFAKWLQKVVKTSDAFTVTQLGGRPGCRWSRTTLYDLVKPLHAVGFLAEAGMDGRSAKHRLAGPLPDSAATWLPAVEDLG